MIKIKNNVFIEDHLRGFKYNKYIGKELKLYFSDRTTKIYPQTKETIDAIESIKDDFLQIGDTYLNPCHIKGFRLKEEGVKIYFPDTTSLFLMFEDPSEAFEDLITYFTGEDICSI